MARVAVSAWGPGDGNHFNLEPGNCAMEHGLCVYVAMDLNPKELTEDVAEAVAMADIATLAEFVLSAPVRMFARETPYRFSPAMERPLRGMSRSLQDSCNHCRQPSTWQRTRSSEQTGPPSRSPGPRVANDVLVACCPP